MFAWIVRSRSFLVRHPLAMPQKVQRNRPFHPNRADVTFSNSSMRLANNKNLFVHLDLLHHRATHLPFAYALFSSIRKRHRVNPVRQRDSIGKRRRRVWPMNQNFLRTSALQIEANEWINRSSFSTCIFCGEKNEDFVRSGGLEQHYWGHCPMLRRCQECNQV